MRDEDRQRLIREALAYAIRRLEEHERIAGYGSESAQLASWRTLLAEMGGLGW